MYDVVITNNYIHPLKAGEATIAPNGGKGTFPHTTNLIVQVTGMGFINFIDLGETKLDNYTNPKIPWTELTWGGLIRYRGLEAYFRYEGTGQVDVVVDKHGSTSVHFKQGGMIVSLPDFNVI